VVVADITGATSVGAGVGATVSVVPVTGGGRGASVGFLVHAITNGVVARSTTGIRTFFFIRKKLKYKGSTKMDRKSISMGKY
jgi:hypothetical protein